MDINTLRKNASIDYFVLAVIHACSVFVSLSLFQYGFESSSIWIPNAVLLGILISYRPVNTGILFPVLFFIQVLINLLFGISFLNSFLFPIADLVGVFFAFTVLKDKKIKKNLFLNFESMVYFILITAVSALFSGMLGIIPRLINGETINLSYYLLTYSVSLFSPYLVITPLFVTFFSKIEFQIEKTDLFSGTQISVIAAIFLFIIYEINHIQNFENHIMLIEYPVYLIIFFFGVRYPPVFNAVLLFVFYLFFVFSPAKTTIFNFQLDIKPLNHTFFTNLNFIIIGVSANLISGLLYDFRRNKSELKKESYRYKVLFENAPVSYLYIAENDFSILGCNNTFSSEFGYAFSEVQGQHLKDFIDADDNNFIDSAKEFVRESNNSSLETVFQSGYGRKINVAMSFRKLDGITGENSVLYVTLFNVSELKMAKVNAISADEKYKLLFDQSELGVALIDIFTGELTEYNDSFCKNLGFTPFELTGKTIYDLEAKFSREQIPDQIKYIMSRELTIFETLLRSKEGKILDFRVTIKKITLYNKDFLQGIFTDITEDKKAQRIQKEDEAILTQILQLNKLHVVSEESFLHTGLEGLNTLLESEFSFVNYSFDSSIINVISPRETPQEVREYILMFINEAKPYLDAHLKHFLLSEKFECIGEQSSIWVEGFTVIAIIFDDNSTFLIGSAGKNGGFGEGEIRILKSYALELYNLFIIKRTEIANRKLIKAIEQSPNSIVITDLEGNIEYVNPFFENTTGYSSAEVIGQNPRILSSGFKTRYEYQDMWETILKGDTWSGLFQNKKKNGDLFWESATIAPVKNEDGKVINFISVKEDITAQKKAQEELEHSEEQFHAVWEFSKDAMRLTDETGIVLKVNPAFCTLFEIEENKVVDHLFNVVYENSNLADSIEHYHARFSAEKFEEYAEREMTLHNGKRLWIQTLSSIIETKEEKQLLTILRDVTSQKMAEFQLMEAKDAAEEMNRLKNNFLANMSHELRTPLISIIGFSEILLEEVEDEFLKGMIESIFTGGQRLKTTIESLIDISFLESAKKKTNFTDTDIVPYLELVFSEYATSASAKNLNYELINPYSQIIFSTDDKIFCNILRHLISNAIKYTEVGFVTVSVKSKKEGKISIEITDSGIGIEESDFNKIFEPFRQVSEGAGRKFEGNGLGLTLIKKYTQFLDGELNFKSKIDAGSTFTVSFKADLIVEKLEIL
ncbi:MAG: PAS domain S-box protein [Ignavibacteriaceae bacterium]|nr:PAS domain S-box protein [Ignavibacteriaceae bacterium]